MLTLMTRLHMSEFLRGMVLSYWWRTWCWYKRMERPKSTQKSWGKMVKAMGELKVEGVPSGVRYLCFRLGVGVEVHLLVVYTRADVAGVDGESVEYELEDFVEGGLGDYHGRSFKLRFFELLFNGIFIWVIIVFGSCGYWVEIGR